MVHFYRGAFMGKFAVNGAAFAFDDKLRLRAPIRRF